MTHETYRSDNLLVRVIPGDGDGWVVSFDHVRDEHGFDHPGFGEDFLRREGIPSIQILSAHNGWYQHADTLKACAAVRAVVEGAPRVVAYGSSMGAYAAVRLGWAVGATATLAISPQYSIDPRKVPFEHRWTQESGAISADGWNRQVEGPITSGIVPYIVFDPFDLDLRHIELIEAEIPIQRLPVPFVGHPVTGYLAEVGLLGELLRAVYAGDDPRVLLQAHRHRRMNSAFYLGGLAEHQPPYRIETAIRLAERAVAHNPQSGLGLRALGRLLSRAGRHADAVTAHARAAEATDRDGSVLPDYADALAAAGEHEQAVKIAAEALDRFPQHARIHFWYGHHLWLKGDRSEALEVAKRAYAMEANPIYAERIRTYEHELTTSPLRLFIERKARKIRRRLNRFAGPIQNRPDHRD